MHAWLDAGWLASYRILRVLETSLAESATVNPISLYSIPGTLLCIYIFPPFHTPPPSLSTFDVLLPPTHMHACCDAFAHTHTHVQNGETALWLACRMSQEAAAAELMEATKLADALDLQVGHEA